MPVFSQPQASLGGGGGDSSWADGWFEDFGLDSIITRQFERENQHVIKEYENARTYERRDCAFFHGDTDKKLGVGTGYLFAAPQGRKRKRLTASEWKEDMEEAIVEGQVKEREEDLLDDDGYGGAKCAGDDKLKQIQFLLDDILRKRGWEREESQKKLHRSYIIAALPQIYGKDWEVHSQRVLKRFGVTDLKSLVLAMYPRRFGKTISIANFVSVVLVVISGITISTFSTGRRASGSMMEEVVRLISENPHLLSRVLTQNQEKLRVAEKAAEGKNQQLSPVNASTFNSYPSNPKGQYIILLHTVVCFRSTERERKKILHVRSIYIYTQITPHSSPCSLSWVKRGSCLVRFGCLVPDPSHRNDDTRLHILEPRHT